MTYENLWLLVLEDPNASSVTGHDFDWALR